MKNQPLNQDAKKLLKPVLRSSTIERLATARNTSKVSSAESKSSQPKKSTLKENGSSTTVSQKTARVEDKKSSTNKVKVKASDKKSGTNKVLSGDSDAHGKDSKEVPVAFPTEPAESNATQPTDIIDDFKDNQELQSTSIEKTEGNVISQRNTSEDRNSNGNMLTEGGKPVQLDHVEGYEDFTTDSTVVSEDKRAPENFDEDIPERTVHPLPPLPNKTVRFSTVNIEWNGAMNEKYLSPRISEIEISTPPNDGMDMEPVHSRKKWNNDENPPKAAKGFRKLLFFGRKSRNSPTK